ncbi:MGMT family protein [Phaeodactylibacter luteus]|uniref:MGMT family protein n=1 Tax=Phaeodactylibacter luteus TaxID=1564516 RepID=A0A5C6RJZ9_9BACT|nr:MGMT family protein [Phaeodactylibacter luteus]TXB62020.1 MGMT family protein [Phaeodactylibacter luteus]
MAVPTYHTLVFAVAREIPPGRVSTYGAIADYLALGSARMVGWALNKSFAAGHDVPAHRVVNRKGELSGRAHFPTPTMMEELLQAEGVAVADGRVQDFEAHFWHPKALGDDFEIEALKPG